MRASLYSLLADTVLAVHVAIAAFVVAGLMYIILGNVRKWPGANAPWFRLAHAGAIGIIVIETLLQYACPLTVLEMWLRANAHESVYSGSFIAHWLQWLLYYDLPAWVFALGYSLFALLVVAAWFVFPPDFRRRRRCEASRNGFGHV